MRARPGECCNHPVCLSRTPKVIYAILRIRLRPLLCSGNGRYKKVMIVVRLLFVGWLLFGICGEMDDELSEFAYIIT